MVSELQENRIVQKPKSDSQGSENVNSSEEFRNCSELFKNDAGLGGDYIKETNSSKVPYRHSSLSPQNPPSVSQIVNKGEGSTRTWKQCCSIDDKQYELYLVNGDFIVKTDYNIDWIVRFRLVGGKKWNPDTKEWSFPLSSLDQFIKLFPEFFIPEEIKLEADRMRDPLKHLRDLPEIETFQGNLYPFQKVGVKFLITAKKAFLCDDMGTGKTIMSIAASCILLEEGTVQKVVVFCPSSLKKQWESEIRKFTTRKPITISGPPAARGKIWHEAVESDFIILNYEKAIIDLDLQNLQEFSHKYKCAFILDEATRIKSWKAKSTRAIKVLNGPAKFLLTGTPIENTPQELHSLNEFLDNGRLGPWGKFDQQYVVRNAKGWITGYKHLKELHTRIEGIMLRRKKEEVLPDLPEKTIQIYSVEMTDVERKDYESIKEIVLQHLIQAEQDPENIEVMALFQSTQFLKMFCDHPDLVRQSTSEIVDQLSLETKTSSKLKELKYIVNEIVAGGNKVIIFTEFLRMVLLIEKEIPGVITYHGQKSETEKDQAVKDFLKLDKYPIFCSTDAGSHGLNLQEACSYLINYDLPWNPAILKQRMDRIHRIGQTDKVNIINLIIGDDDAIEQRVSRVLDKKEKIFEKVIEGK